MNIIIYYKAKTYTKPHSPYYVMRFMVLSRKVLFPGMIQKSCWLEDCQTKSATLKCSQYELLNPCGDPWELPADAFKFTPSHIPLVLSLYICTYLQIVLPIQMTGHAWYGVPFVQKRGSQCTSKSEIFIIYHSERCEEDVAEALF